MVDRPAHLPDDTAIYTDEDGVLWGLDDHGEFPVDPPRGESEKLDGRCNAVLKFSQQRYGETRYCGVLESGTFGETKYEHPEYCGQHQSRHHLMERAIELVQHGYFGRNYAIFEETLDASEFAFAVSMFAGLLEQSKYEYEVQTETFTIDSSDDRLVPKDEIAVEVPFPGSQKYQTQANELWYFALDEIVEQRMQHIRLTKGVDGEHVVATADEDGVITDSITEASESHMNLPISRLTKDKKERLKIGGVEVGAEDDGGMLTFTTGDFVVDMENEVPEDVEELDEPLTPMLEAEVDDEDE